MPGYPARMTGIRVNRGARSAVYLAMIIASVMATSNVAAATAARAPVDPPAIPSVPLGHASVPGLTMPAMGLGTGGYGPINLGYGKYPECWVEAFGCGNNTARAVKTWLADAGGRRLDSADSYFNQESVARGILESGVPRDELFILSKIGNTWPMGYNDTLTQFAGIQEKLGVDSVDALLVHWPTSKPNALDGWLESKDPVCNTTNAKYNEVTCRRDTWRAMVKIFNDGGAKSIGVSNYNQTHIEEIIADKQPLPSINQIHVHAYSLRTQKALIDYCQKQGIVVLGYSPLGIPDWHSFPPPLAKTTLEEPKIQAIASTHNRTSADIILANLWQLGIPSNPRSMSLLHMQQNLAVFDIKLSAAEQDTIMGLPQDTCSIDGSFYECSRT